MNLLDKTSLWLKYQRSKNTIEMSAPWVFYHCVNQYNNRPPMGGTVWEESSLTEGVEDKKGTSGRRGACLLPLWCGCCCPGRRGCRSQVRMRTPFGFLTPEALLFFVLFFFTDSSRKCRCFSVGFFVSVFVFFMHMCEKAGKARVCSVPPPSHESDKSDTAAREGFGISRISLWKSFEARKDGECLKKAFRKEKQRRRENVKTSSKYGLRGGDNIIQ